MDFYFSKRKSWKTVKAGGDVHFACNKLTSDNATQRGDAPRVRGAARLRIASRNLIACSARGKVGRHTSWDFPPNVHD
ncbi:hypothetical protein SNOG_08361 [Parastagonospora nodorum SN15]|uniref:Uncharacterized protein n=1 Tax=Phaeosphaeria nodorum (strain SN15 / ATCC MYA-4574 / FGSC 10173) TaxID=321614 RepID=Q0UIQ3_PHANO|nr:hypothetical protein SNOG_08361 [Parastagonospora nodorum SN15]EAT84637.1 hypothetical protein SNOG_08361 [Parastagonospora nodorum SN15]